MRRYTTPTIGLCIEGIDITDADIYVTFESKDNTVTVKNPDAAYENGNTIIECPLTQEQTASFGLTNQVVVQVNWVYSNGKRNATEIKAVSISDNLIEKVVEYGDTLEGA